MPRRSQLVPKGELLLLFTRTKITPHLLSNSQGTEVLLYASMARILTSCKSPLMESVSIQIPENSNGTRWFILATKVSLLKRASDFCILIAMISMPFYSQSDLFF